MATTNTLLTKGQRRKAASAGRFTTDEIEIRYRDMLRGLYQYSGDGLPDDMPYGFIEADALFYAAGAAFKDVPGLGFCAFGANPVTVSIYGTPVSWLPQNVWGMNASQATEAVGIFKESDAPVFWNRCSQQERIRPYIEILRRSLNTLFVNLAALNHPTVIQGVASGRPGDNIASIMLESELDDGATFIPTVRPGDPLGLNAIDLGISDNTQNLISTCDWADTQIKAILGLDTGIEKASGIGAFDAKGTGALATSTDAGLELRREWLEKVNSMFGTSITVSRNADITASIGADDNGTMATDQGVDPDDQDPEESDNRRPGHDGRRPRREHQREGIPGSAGGGCQMVQEMTQCPYGSGTCPKVDELEKDVDSVKLMVSSMQRTLYVIAGILFCELGVTIV